MLKRPLQIILSCCLLFLGSCNDSAFLSQNHDSNKISKQEITIAAASSLKEVITDIDQLWSATNPKATTNYTFASSGTLQRQIEQGAPVDIFISADSQKIDALISQNLIQPSSNFRLLQNQIVLVSSKNNPLKLDSFNDLQKNKEIRTIAIGKSELVPAGKYAEQVLGHFNLITDLQSKLVFAKDVRQVLNYVITGNADVGFVYLTDALAHSNDVKVTLFAPTESYEPIYYAIAITQDSSNPKLAKEFSDFLQTPQVQKVFTEKGFKPVVQEELK